MTRLLVCLTLLVALPARADRFSTALALEAWGDDTIPAHGVALLAWETRPLWRDMQLSVEYNTDTLRFGVNGARFGKLEVSALLTAQFGLTGLLTDYYRNGNSVPGQGFTAHQVAFDLSAKAEIASRTWLEVAMCAQRFVFSELDREGNETNAALVLPDNPLLFKPRLRYTWWNLADDAGWGDRHRFFPRVRGLAIGAELGVDIRSNNTSWGARDADAFSPIDLRNTPDKAAVLGTVWLKAGWQIANWARTQIQGNATIGQGQDDLTRDRIGGMSPYSVMLPGAPWASWMSSRYVADAWSWHFKAAEGLEIGPVLGAVLLTDPDRVDAQSETALLWGAGLLVDWRIGDDWQVDLRSGYSPSVSDRANRTAWSSWIGVGWAYED
ncbi:MAG: hypothetical protein ACI9U2_000518 [Bradymonadia bacterium]|jgi:hypothetical protein